MLASRDPLAADGQPDGMPGFVPKQRSESERDLRASDLGRAGESRRDHSRRGPGPVQNRDILPWFDQGKNDAEIVPRSPELVATV